VGSELIAAAVAGGVHQVTIPGCRAELRIVVSRYYQNSLLPNAYLLFISVRPQSNRDQSDPNEMVSQREAPPPWATTVE